MTNLPQDLIERVIECYDRFLKDDEVAPGSRGKIAFFRGVIANPNFLPKDLQTEINARRGETPQRDYLLRQPEIQRIYFEYLTNRDCSQYRRQF